MPSPDLEHDDVLLDRLVDGELDSAERRALLVSLENREDGWRRCALAFLEAQALRCQLTGMVDEVAHPADGPTSRRTTPDKRRPRLGWLAVAAGIAAAFAAGTLVPSSRSVPNGPAAAPSAIVAKATDDASLGPTAADLVDNQTQAARDSIDAANALRLWVRNSQGQAQPLNVPLVDATALDQELGLEFRSGISDELREQLAAEGYRVESRQRYAPLWIDQGQPLVVPVEDTRIVPIEWHVY